MMVMAVVGARSVTLFIHIGDQVLGTTATVIKQEPWPGLYWNPLSKFVVSGLHVPTLQQQQLFNDTAFKKLISCFNFCVER